MPQGLLDHQKIELVKFAQVFDFIQRVSGVGVTTEHDFRPAGANALQHIYIPARLDFYLDSAISGSKFGLNLIQQLFD